MILKRSRPAVSISTLLSLLRLRSLVVLVFEVRHALVLSCRTVLLPCCGLALHCLHYQPSCHFLSSS